MSHVMLCLSPWSLDLLLDFQKQVRIIYLSLTDGDECSQGHGLGKPAPLVSTFRLSYYSILNLMSRAEGQFTAEHVIKNSFHQFQYEKVFSEPFL